MCASGLSGKGIAIKTSSASLLALAWLATAGPLTGSEKVSFGGDVAKAKEVWTAFEKWLAAYSNADLKAVMTIFDKDVRFLFQGSKEHGYSDLELSYLEDFKSRKPGTAWVPAVDEVYAEGRLAIVRAIGNSKLQARTEKLRPGRAIEAWMCCALAMMANGAFSAP